MTRLITRHSNRKLYDSTAKRYVSLADIVNLVVSGASVKVVEHPSGDDATPRILAQALVDLVKRRARSLPAGLMETLLRLAGGTGVPSRRESAAPARIKDLAERAGQGSRSHRHASGGPRPTRHRGGLASAKGSGRSHPPRRPGGRGGDPQTDGSLAPGPCGAHHRRPRPRTEGARNHDGQAGRPGPDRARPSPKAPIPIPHPLVP